MPCHYHSLLLAIRYFSDETVEPQPSLGHWQLYGTQYCTLMTFIKYLWFEVTEKWVVTWLHSLAP